LKSRLTRKTTSIHAHCELEVSHNHSDNKLTSTLKENYPSAIVDTLEDIALGGFEQANSRNLGVPSNALDARFRDGVARILV